MCECIAVDKHTRARHLRHKSVRRRIRVVRERRKLKDKWRVRRKSHREHRCHGHALRRRQIEWIQSSRHIRSSKRNAVIVRVDNLSGRIRKSRDDLVVGNWHSSVVLRFCDNLRSKRCSSNFLRREYWSRRSMDRRSD